MEQASLSCFQSVLKVVGERSVVHSCGDLSGSVARRKACVYVYSETESTAFMLILPWGEGVGLES
jgi:hypothetical protein